MTEISIPCGRLMAKNLKGWTGPGSQKPKRQASSKIMGKFLVIRIPLREKAQAR